MRKPKITRGRIRDLRQEDAERWIEKGAGVPPLPPAPTVANEAEAVIREFSTGATRDLDNGKLDYEGFLSPQVLEAFAEYMNFHRDTAVGRRESDNWQNGFPFPVLMKSMWRHFVSFWRWHRFNTKTEQNKANARGLQSPLEDLMGIVFNAQAYARQLIEDDPESTQEMLRVMHLAREQRQRGATGNG